MTDSEVLYRVSIGYDPRLMARKQIIQLGLKFVNKDIVCDNNYLISRNRGSEYRPFELKFRTEFNLLPLETRKFVIDYLDTLNKWVLENKWV